MDINSLNLELASELAHLRTVEDSKNNNLFEDGLFKDPNSTVLEYKDDIQDIFNFWYDYYLTEIEKIYTQPLKEKPTMTKKLTKQEIDTISRKAFNEISKNVNIYNDKVLENVPSPLTSNKLETIRSINNEKEILLITINNLQEKLDAINTKLGIILSDLFPNIFIYNKNLNEESFKSVERSYKIEYCKKNNIELGKIPNSMDILDELILNNSGGEISEIIDSLIKKFSPNEKNN